MELKTCLYPVFRTHTSYVNNQGKKNGVAAVKKHKEKKKKIGTMAEKLWEKNTWKKLGLLLWRKDKEKLWLAVKKTRGKIEIATVKKHT